MRKAILNAYGRLYLKVNIASKGTIRTVTGNATSPNVKKDLQHLKRNALLDALYQFRKNTGTANSPKGNEDYQVLDYHIDYFEEKISIKRVNQKHKYYTVIRNTETGRIVSRSKWTSRENNEIYEKNEDFS